MRVFVAFRNLINLDNLSGDPARKSIQYDAKRTILAILS